MYRLFVYLKPAAETGMHTSGNIFNAISKSKKGLIIRLQSCAEDSLPCLQSVPSLIPIMEVAENKH